jgi:hypothetical protein
MRLLQRHRPFSLFITRCAGAIFLLRALPFFDSFLYKKKS